ncbi:MAG: hypothetical protein PHD81_01950 [Candidatus Nanoarchaeia archaeon]|nr:hypothetical protein [Candidatus Nanoarchaeia archaeon]MDD5587852.1 hypothetical protein [Candidatus Nanoarchaeia archaeon]
MGEYLDKNINPPYSGRVSELLKKCYDSAKSEQTPAFQQGGSDLKLLTKEIETIQNSMQSLEEEAGANAKLLKERALYI